ncbi:hypothetical protein GCM10020295_10580 [Streptomyces cinereospinus]
MAVADGARHLAGPDHARQQRRIETHAREDLLVVGLAARRPPAGARGVAPVGRALPGEAFGEVVVGQPHGPRGADRRRLVLGEPGPLGDREGRGGHAARAVRPDLRAAQFLDQPARLGRRAHVVPQQGGPDRLAPVVQGDETVLLAADGDRGGLVGGFTALAQCLAQRVPPLPRITLPAGAGGDRVRRLPARHDLPGGRVDDQRLGGLGGRVHADDERTLGC